MKILHVITRIDPGGSTDICLETINILKKNGNEVILAHGITEEPPVGDFLLKYLKREIGFLKDFRAVLELVKIIKKTDPDVLHLHTSKAGFVGRLAALLTGKKKVIYQPHGIVFYGYFSRLKSRAILFAERALAAASKYIVVLTNTAKEEFLKYRIAAENKFIVIENGIDQKKFYNLSLEEKEIIRKTYRFSSEDFIIGMVGRIVELKGHIHLLNAINMVKDKIPGNTKIIIVGDGPHLPLLKRKANEYSLDETVVFTGYKKNTNEIMNILDLLVQPSHVEGFGLVIAEAAACSVPSIGFKVGGITDIIIDNRTGLLSKYMDESELAEKIVFAVNNKTEIRKMGKNAYSNFIENYTLQKMEKRVLDLYRRFL